jgi:hypothetical protein
LIDDTRAARKPWALRPGFFIGRKNRSGNIVAKSDKTKKKGLKPNLPKSLFLFGEPCRDRTDNLLIKSHIY